MRRKVEAKPEATVLSKISEFVNFLLVSGLLAWIITLTCSLFIFMLTLFYSEKNLLYALIFFGISIIGQIFFPKKR